jgi:hypothetical protein
MNLRKVVSLTLGIIAGNVVAERFILKNSPESPTGFILVSDGIGLDEVARAVSGVGMALVFDWALGFVWKQR